MIENTAPKKMGISQLVPGYAKVYLAHTQYYDADTQGKQYYIESPVWQETDSNLHRLYSVLSGFTSNTDYTLQGAFFDSFVDSQMLAAKVGIILSDTESFKTRKEPTLTGYSVSSPEVDVGVGTPTITFTIGGEATRVIIEKSTAGANNWSIMFNGTKENAVTIPINPGTYDFRMRGVIDLPDGATQDYSAYSNLTGIGVSYQFQPPSKPTTPTFKVAKVMDGVERYDVKVDWTWDKGVGTNVREFVLYFVTTEEYTKTSWAKAATINGGSSKSAVITGFPFNKDHTFKVEAVAWGPDSLSTTPSDNATLTVDSNTPLDQEFTTDTGIELTYAHLTAYKKVSGVNKQTFKIDAATGSVAIGLLDAQGEAPITFDPTNDKVNVKGSVITEEIVSASFVMADLSGTDNPAFRTSNKTDYTVGGDGIWMGYDSTDTKFKMDIGSASQFIRWDGDQLIISGGVQISGPSGNTPLSDGLGGSGVGIYSYAVTPITAWDDATALLFYTTTFGASASPALYDVLTLIDSADASNIFTRQYDGTNWVTPTLLVNGSIVATDTITADKLVGDSAFLNKAGIDVIYDKAAGLGTDPETDYIMKIDLSAGSIHIR